MNVWSIALKDLQIFVRERGAILYLFLLPALFILMFAGLGATVSLGEEALPTLPIVNNDTGEMGTLFIQALEETNKVELLPMSQTEAEEQLSQLDIGYALFIPADFSANLAKSRNTFLSEEEDEADTAVSEPQVNVKLIVHPNHNETELATVERIISRATRSIAMTDYLNDSLAQLREMQAANPDVDLVFTEQRIQQQIDTQQASAETRPLVVVRETTPAGISQPEVMDIELPTLGQVAVVGFTVLFVFLAAQKTAESIYEEKRLGSFRRLLAAPISKSTLLGGKLVPNFILTLIQTAVIFLVGMFIIPLIGVPRLDFSNNPLGLLIAALVIALCSTCLGIFIAGLARTPGQVSGLSSMLLWVAAIIGGSMIPAFLFPEGLQNFSRLVPHYWANQVYFDLIFRQATLLEVMPSLLVLIGFSVFFFAVGVWRFDFD